MVRLRVTPAEHELWSTLAGSGQLAEWIREAIEIRVAYLGMRRLDAEESGRE